METMIQILIIAAVIWFLMSRLMPVKGVAHITVQDAKAKFKDKNIQFVDVRTPGEYKANHRKPFKNIPLAQIANQTKILDKDKEVVIICQTGMRSMRAAKILKKQGFEKVTNVKGGMGTWI